MKTILFLLFAAFTALTSGATIRNHFKHGCKGGFLLYKNISPRSCASALHKTPNQNPDIHGASSAKFSAMPHNARLFGWQGNRAGLICGVVKKRANTGGSNHKCVGVKSPAQFAGTSWARAVNAKREDDPQAASNETCTASVGPSAVVLDDGHMYNVDGMDDGLFDELYDLAMNGTTSGALPKEYDEYEEDQGGVEERLQDMQGEEEED